MRWMVALVFVLGCGESHPGPLDASADMAVAPDLAAPPDLATPVDMGIEPDLGGPTPTGCGAELCAEGERCCFATGTCVDASDPSACVADSPGECASNADCGAGEICRSSAGTCLGVGTCEEAQTGCSPRDVCGCDGRTYGSTCQAERAGVRVARLARRGGVCGSHLPPTDGGGCSDGRSCPTGEECRDGTCAPADAAPLIACGAETACPGAMECCAITGLCVESDCESCCREPDPGGLLPCESDAHCGAIGFDAFCLGEGCAGPGSCIYPPSSCDGVLEPVCGCDGVSYSNPCWAHTASARVEAVGSCPDE